MQPPPRVTITDPSRPDPGPPDELDGEQPRSRRGLYAVLLLVAALVAWRGVDTVLDRRAADAEERRLAAVVELELTQRFSGGGSSSRSDDDVATVTRNVGLRNTGPRPVELLSVRYSGLAFEGSRTVRPGREEAFALTARTDCSSRPPETAPGTALSVRVRNAAGQVVEQEVPLPDQVFLSDPGELRRACGYLDVFEGSLVFVESTVRRGSAVEVQLQALNQARTPVSLVGVTGGSGIAAEVVADLPLVLLPPVQGLEQPQTVLVRLTVEDCALVQTDAQPFDGGAPSSLQTTFTGADGQTTTTFNALEGGDAEALVEEVCA